MAQGRGIRYFELQINQTSEIEVRPQPSWWCGGLILLEVRPDISGGGWAELHGRKWSVLCLQSAVSGICCFLLTIKFNWNLIKLCGSDRILVMVIEVIDPCNHKESIQTN